MRPEGQHAGEASAAGRHVLAMCLGNAPVQLVPDSFRVPPLHTAPPAATTPIILQVKDSGSWW